MEITENIILDLWPLYLTKEASTDSSKLVEDYLKANPQFAEKMDYQSGNLELIKIKKPLIPEEEMDTLQKTKKLVRVRSLLMGFAIFVSALPFTINFNSGSNEGTQWLWAENPAIAVFLGLIGLGLWGAYYFINKRLSI